MTMIAEASKDPLAPEVLNQAGVPLEDALWLTRQPLKRKVNALREPRGQRILERVRTFVGVQTFMKEVAGHGQGHLMTA